MASRVATVLTVLAVISFGAVRSDAALLLNDANAMVGWTGEQTFSKTDGVFSLNVTVEFAVYAPGKFDDSFGVDPSGGTEYVYAYQIFNVDHPAGEEVSKLSIGLLPLCGAHNIGVLASPPVEAGSIVPTGYRLSGSSARWNFDDPTILHGQQSVILYFTSLQAPQWLSGSIQDGGLADTQAMPSASPAPEPTTCAFLLLGGGVTILGWARRHRRASRNGTNHA